MRVRGSTTKKTELTFPSLLKKSSSSLSVTLEERPVTNSVFPGFVSTLPRLADLDLERERDRYLGGDIDLDMDLDLDRDLDLAFRGDRDIEYLYMVESTAKEPNIAGEN